MQGTPVFEYRHGVAALCLAEGEHVAKYDMQRLTRSSKSSSPKRRSPKYSGIRQTEGEMCASPWHL